VTRRRRRFPGPLRGALHGRRGARPHGGASTAGVPWRADAVVRRRPGRPGRARRRGRPASNAPNVT